MTDLRTASETIEDVARTLCGRYHVDIEGGVHIRCQPLPDPVRAAVAVDPVGDTWVFVDLDKPLATRHAWDQLRRRSMELLGVPGRMLAVAAASELVCALAQAPSIGAVN